MSFNRDAFVAQFDGLVKDIIDELPKDFEMPDYAVKWIETLLRQTVPGGKMNRGLTVVHSLQLLKGEQPLTDKEQQQAVVLGWCIEWLQAYFLVADDLMDLSLTRRGLPCWYLCKRPIDGATDDDKIGTIATNDSFIIFSTMFRVIRKHFRSHPAYSLLLDLFHEVTYQTELGQLLDLTSQPSDKSLDLSLFTLETYRKIVKYKTAFYSFYLPVALAFYLHGIVDDESHSKVRSILLEMGEYFQIQDDYLDCYGDPAVIGKVGRDIEERKCGWLVVQALLICSPEQREILAKHYGTEDPEDVKKVKALYKELDLEGIFKKYEEESFVKLTGMIEELGKTHAQGQAVCAALLKKIYKRSL